MNTREGRKRDRLDTERREAIGECMKLNPFYKPPAGYRPVLKESKLFIPAKENPGYNFIGLILGPRGNTQKRLETETGCRITIRGKGSIKDGKTVPYRFGKDNDGMSEDLHVHIAAETYEKVDAAVDIIAPLLIPVDEDRNIYKMKQLRELAEMNGTVFDLRRICTLCGEEGHRDWQCPKDKLQTFQAKVICRLCGDASHPTMDCPLKISGQGKTIDKEYLNFLEELGVGLGDIDPMLKSDSDAHMGEHTADASPPPSQNASGILPFPAKWMEGFNEFNRRMAAGGSEVGGFPRFPFPFPFPPGPQAFRFLAPFFNPAFFELFKNRPFPPPLPMMAFMLSAFRGRFPFPPFGFRPEMMRPPVPPSPSRDSASMMPMNVSTPVSAPAGDQSSFYVDKVAESKNPEDLPSFTGATDDFQQQQTVVSTMALNEQEQHTVDKTPEAAIPAGPSESESRPRSPPVPLSAPAVSPIQSGDVQLPSSGLPVSPVVSPPILPLVRPVPSVRPPFLDPPTFTPVGTPSLPSTIGGSAVGATNWSSSISHSVPAQLWGGCNEGQPPSTYQSEKPVLECNPSGLSTSGTLGALPPRIGDPYSFNFTDSRGIASDNQFPSSHPPSFPMNISCYTPSSVPFSAPPVPSASGFSPNFIHNPPQNLSNNFGMVSENQPRCYAPSYADSHIAPPLPAVTQSQLAGSLHAEMYSQFSSSSQPVNPAFTSPASSMVNTGHAYYPSSTFSSDLPYSRGQESFSAASTDPYASTKYRSSDMYRSGPADLFHTVDRSLPGSMGQEFRGSTSQPFETDYKYEPSVPPHFLHQTMKSPWSMDFHGRPRP
ncbi:hypothetical protein KP509_25G061400 [Ceratopteris richardii]|nr:hypothetical protein KP509_25G061400 [Ceratopteris richardii]KAH7298851.1 hypothetical protein KP509_25G061400 [Ceratopteris richardii]